MTSNILGSNIKQTIISLDPAKRKLLINELSKSERKAMINILAGNTLPKNVCQSIIEHLNNVKNLTPEFTVSQKINPWFYVKEKFISIVGNYFKILNYYSIQKTNELVSRTLHEKDSLSTAKHISKKNLKKLIKFEKKKLPQGTKIDLGDLLRKNGYSHEFYNINFSHSESFSKLNLDGIVFNSCVFNYSNFYKSDLKNVSFLNCEFVGSNFTKSNLDDCLFKNCELREVMFVGSQFNNTDFLQTSIISSSFEDAMLADCKFFNVCLPATHFLEANIKSCDIYASKLTDTVFFNTKEAFNIDKDSNDGAKITKPVTGMLIDPFSRGYTTPKAFFHLDHSAHQIPLRIAAIPVISKKKIVNHEIENLLKEIGDYDKKKLPIPQQLLKKISENSNSNEDLLKILKKAKNLATQVDAIYLPGGDDLPPKFYGQQESKKTKWNHDYRRSLFEICLVNESINKGVPLMAVCRGFQMANVFFGAQLVQDIKGHTNERVQKYKLNNSKELGLYHRALKHSILGISSHHQAVTLDNPPTDYLESSIVHKNVIKASESKFSGNVPLILLQFHPEFYKAKTFLNAFLTIRDSILNARISKENEVFWNILSDSAQAYRKKKDVLSAIKGIKTEKNHNN